MDRSGVEAQSDGPHAKGLVALHKMCLSDLKMIYSNLQEYFVSFGVNIPLLDSGEATAVCTVTQEIQVAENDIDVDQLDYLLELNDFVDSDSGEDSIQ